jgi:hypothetical protein
MYDLDTRGSEDVIQRMVVGWSGVVDGISVILGGEGMPRQKVSRRKLPFLVMAEVTGSFTRQVLEATSCGKAIK